MWDLQKKFIEKKGHVLLEDPSSKWGTRNDTQRSTSQEFCALCTLENKKIQNHWKFLRYCFILERWQYKSYGHILAQLDD